MATDPPWAAPGGFTRREIGRAAARRGAAGGAAQTWQVHRHPELGYRPPPGTLTVDDEWLSQFGESTPRTDPGPLDLPLLMKVLRRMESDAHRRGWDKNPVTLFIVYDHSFRRTAEIIHQCVGNNPRIWGPARVGTYTGQYLFAPGLLDGVPGVMGPWEPLRTFAMNLAYATAENCGGDLRNLQQANVLRETLRLDGIVGVGVQAEVWIRRLTEEQADAEADRFVRYADQPDSVEGRKLWLVDMRNRVHSVGRTRGDKPFTVTTPTGDRTLIRPNAHDTGQREAVDTAAFGDVTTSLRIIVDMIMGRTPPEADFGQRYPTVQEALAAARAQDPELGGE